MTKTSRIKRTFSRILMIMVLCMTMSGCVENDKKFVASVNGENITLDVLEKNYIMLEPQYKKKFNEDIMSTQVEGKTVREIVRLKVLETLVRDVLIKQYMIKEGYKPKNEDVDMRYNDFMAIEIQKKPENKRLFEENKIDKAFIKESIRNQMYLNEFEKRIREEVNEQTESVEALYKTYVTQIKAQHILVTDEMKAKEISDKLDKGEKFEDLAKAYSQDKDTAYKGGDLGWFSRKVMPVEFTQVAFKMKVGEVKKAIKTKYGFHFVKVNGIKTLQDFIDEKGAPLEIEREKTSMLENLIQEKKAKMIEELAAKAKIERFDDMAK